MRVVLPFVASIAGGLKCSEFKMPQSIADNRLPTLIVIHIASSTYQITRKLSQ